MKRKFLYLLVALFITVCALSLVGCDFFGGEPPIKDYNADIKVVAPENIDTEHFLPDENETYYTSPGFSLVMEVNGEFLIMDYFYLDGNKRVYDNLYFYKDDYFFIVTDDYKDLYASLGDSADLEYAEEEKQLGEDIQINILKDGIYKLIFDVDTLKFDLEFKANIETPVYYTIKNCSIYSVATNWVKMSVNPANEDEFVICNFNVTAGKSIYFYNNIHTSNYKVTLDENANNKLASARKTQVTVNVGGNYNIYINRKTYVVRMELLSPSTATYGCVYYDGANFIELQPYEVDVPYVFHFQLNAEKHDFFPNFYSTAFRKYSLKVTQTDYVVSTGNSYFFTRTGRHNLIINLRTFEISVELLPE
ncbi:MAG: hypothetical protein IJV99_00545 [Clostridia bacterium]|nr:hypothetical protein [Clostridia bacterium]